MDDGLALLQPSSLEKSPNLDEVLAAAARGVCEALQADASLIGLAQGDAVVFRASHNLPEEVLADFRMDRGAPLEGMVFRTGKPYVCGRLTRRRGYADSLGKRLGIRSGLMVPLEASGDVVGCLYVGSFTHHRFTDDDLRVACVFARQIAGAVVNAFLLERERRERQRSHTLLELVRAAGSSLSVKEVLVQVCDAAARLSVADRCSILLLNESGEKLEPLMSLGFKNERLWQRFRAMAPLSLAFLPGMRDAFLRQTPILIGHADRTRLIPQSMVKNFGMKTVGIYPMAVRDEVVGIMVVDTVEEYMRFPEEEVETMTAIARQAAVIIDNARLFEQEQKQRRRAEALSQIVGTAGSSLSVKEVLVNLCRSVVDLSVGERCSIFLFNAESDTLEPIMSLGPEDPVWWEKFRDSAGLGIPEVRGIGTAADVQEPVIEEHAPGSGIIPDYWIETFGLKSLALYPMAVKDRTVGVMAVDSYTDFVRFPAEEVDTLAAVARQAAVVIENAKLFEQEQKQRRRTEALSQILGAASSTLSLDKVIISLCRSVVDLSIGERCTIFLTDRSTGGLLPYMSLGPEDEGMWEKFRSIADMARTPELGLVVKAIASIRGPIIQENVPATELLPPDWVKSFGVKSLAVYPLMLKEETIGVMAVDSYSDFVHFPPEEVETMMAIAGQAAVVIENARLFEQVQQQAIADPLTGLYNHRHLRERLEQEMARARRGRRPLSVLMMDIDNLKLINDTYGHQVGDEALKFLSSVLRDSCRVEDIVGRYGGDEFTIILPEADPAEAKHVAERIQSSLASRCLKREGEEIPVPVRLSMGLACYPSDTTATHELVDLADGALYRSKQRGGGRITTGRGQVEELMPAAGTAFSSMQGLVAALIQKEPFTRENVGDVAKYCVLIATALGLSGKQKDILRRAGWVHDVGTIAVPDRVVLKSGPLDEDEREALRQHVAFSETILRGIDHLADLVPTVAAHHEWLDGRGYPRGLKGRRIPMTSRILAVADAYQAMTSDRPHRPAMSREKAIEELRRGAGTQFDPKVVEALVQALGSEAVESRAA